MESEERISQNFEGKLGRYKPKFQGKPDDYYQVSCKDISSALSICFLIVIIFFWINVGFFYWSDRVSTSSLVLFCSILLCVFIPLFMIFAYLGSNNKLQIEEKLIKQALNKIVKQKQAKQNKLNEQRPNNELSNSIQNIHRQ